MCLYHKVRNHVEITKLALDFPSFRSDSNAESDYIYRGHFLNQEEVSEVKLSWKRIIGEDTGGHGIKIVIRWDFDSFLTV